ncbi:MAG: hypothetical protein WDN28_01710 [Chthoniobacter sp.]
MMNAPVVMQSSVRLAAKLAALPDDEQRLQQGLTPCSTARPPLDHEKADALAFVRDLGTPETPNRAWALLCPAHGGQRIYLFEVRK